MSPLPTYGEVAAELRGVIDSLALEVLPDGKREGREWRGTGPDGGKWCVVLSGRKQGVFLNTGAGIAGDPLELVRYGVCGGDRRAAFDWALNFLGYSGLSTERARPRPARLAAPRPPQEDPQRMRDIALAMFLKGDGFTWDSPAGRYLTARAIEPGAPIRALRTAPWLPHPEGRRYPAMLAAVIEPITGKYLGTHRTWLAMDFGVWRKAPVKHAKMSLGMIRGGVIPLLRGSSHRTLPKAAEGESVLIAEGIENALSVAEAFPEWRALAAISCGNLVAIDLPPAIRRVMLIADRDGENDAVQRAYAAALRHWADEGRDTQLWKPPAPHKDANAWLKALKGERHHDADRPEG